ncbi:MAG TPA: peptidylprolyl isomerase [Saprospiraceae bacterium]|nr:peptidylprolyl isomerase [Saprospiraceae bacterium]
MRFSLILSLVAVIWTSSLFGQSKDPVLFTVDGQPVPASEFTYIYSKNNRDDADFSEASLREYLDLYTKFKLKVREAYAMGLDTVTSLKTELDGYRKQLAESYLNDKEVTDRLVREAYDRMQEDIHVAHIFIRSNPNVPADTSAAYAKIQLVYSKLKAGESWDDAVRHYSEDNGSKELSGDLGYITALLPSGFYNFETTAYNTPQGTYSTPIRSNIGYHIIKVIGKRPARGEMDVAHILVRVKADESNAMDAKAKIDVISQEIKKGGKFEDAARKSSEDKTTADRGGFIGTMIINQFEKPFEDAVFALQADGDISEPVRTRLGWHIVKRVKKRPVLTYDAAKRKIETQVSRDERMVSAKQIMINRIKQDAGFSIDQNVYDQFLSLIGDDLQTYRWQVPTVDEKPLLTIGKDVYTNIDFGNYIRNNARIRMGVAKGTPNKEIMDKIFSDFVGEKALFYEERNLVNKYPEFKALMREYEEGILLFEATKINVWDKASKDTTGLIAFHRDHRMNYMWEERVEVATLTLDSGAVDKMPMIRKWAAKKSLAVVATKAKKKKIPVQLTRRTYQKDETLPTGLTWTVGQKAELPDGNGIMRVERIIPPQPKSLEEARGYIIADYQDQLEKEWVASLQSKYPIKVDEKVLLGLVKK